MVDMFIEAKFDVMKQFNYKQNRLIAYVKQRIYNSLTFKLALCSNLWINPTLLETSIF